MPKKKLKQTVTHPAIDAGLTPEQKIELCCQRLIWAMAFLHCRGSGIMSQQTPEGGLVLEHWSKVFRDTVRQCGYAVTTEADEP